MGLQRLMNRGYNPSDRGSRDASDEEDISEIDKMENRFQAEHQAKKQLDLRAQMNRDFSTPIHESSVETNLKRFLDPKVSEKVEEEYTK
jgi:hypothetical protein